MLVVRCVFLLYSTFTKVPISHKHNILLIHLVETFNLGYLTFKTDTFFMVQKVIIIYMTTGGANHLSYNSTVYRSFN